MQNRLGAVFSCLIVICLAAAGQSAPSPKPAVTDADEVRIGQSLAEKMIALEGMQSTPQTVKIEKYLQAVTDKVAANAERKLPYRVHYDPDPGFKSAFGLPGGEIFIGAGILAFMDSEDQLATVLAHEIEHIAQNQCRDRLIKVLGEQHLLATDGDKLKVEPFLPGYGKENELAADRLGTLLAAKAGYSPEGAIRILQTFLLMEQQMPNTQSEVRKSLENRVALLRKLVSEEHLPTPKEKPVAWP